jgi:tRNA (5-methylaminomethyl-2-thiouridylate)-methyltransferase
MRVAALVSGGVDSSVSLRLLKEAGHDITAFYLKIWLEDEMSFLGECPWEDDLQYVRAVCDQAGVPLEVVPFQKEYWERIVGYTIDEVKKGRTPNPDVLCNTRVKFGAFYDAVGHGFDRIATGHYAQTEEVRCHPEFISGSPGCRNKFGTTVTMLKRSPDPVKDQTYFLSQLSQAQVARAMFPIGGFQKPEVRALAEKFALPNANRPDSQGLCFLGKIRFDKFLEFHLGKRKGDLIDYETGRKLGEHDGFWYYTIGQRRGIHLSGGPWYVVKKDPEENTVYISNAFRSLETARDTFEVEGLNWISGKPGELCRPELVSGPQENTGRSRNEVGMTSQKLQVKIRHGAKLYGCGLRELENGRLEVKLDETDAGIAPGQFAVFYDGEYCLGGGAIVS